MEFILIVIISLVILGAIAAIFSIGGKDEPIVQKEGDCGSCTSRAECKLAELKEKGARVKEQGACASHEDKQKGISKAVLLLFSYLLTPVSSLLTPVSCLLTSISCLLTPVSCLLTPVSCLLIASSLLLAGCSTKNNTAKTRWWHSFNARYNTYFNGSQAFIEGSLEKEQGNKDNYTELIPLYTVGNKGSRNLGKGNFDRAIEKSEKAIARHSIKARPEWTKNRRKTAKDLEWLNRREYNPFLWRAWLLMGKSQFQKGEFEEAAATFSYMSRLYQTQPAINGLARAWLAKSYVEMDWIYDAEDIIVKQRRDTMHYRAVKDWDYTYADYYIHSGRYEEALPYLRKVIKHEKRRKQKAREWFLYGQLQSLLGRKAEAYDAYKHTIRLNPPYELAFNARIAQTEVMARGSKNAQKMVRKLKRMAASDNNKDYQDQIYYAIGNIWLAERDTTKAIEAYEEGNKKATRSGIEKGVLLLSLGNLYWTREKFADAQRCYGEAIGLLDKDREDYEQLSERSKILDELVPHTTSVELQDSLQRLAKLPEAERLKIIDRIIEELKEKEEEERRLQEEAEAEQALQRQSAQGGGNAGRMTPGRQTTPVGQGVQSAGGAWYFYNPQTVSQGKRTFEQQWGKRENTDDWQRNNKTVVNLNQESGDGSQETGDGSQESGNENQETGVGSLEGTDSLGTDTLANDPHNREYYLAQIPFTEEQVAASNNAIKDGLFHAGIIFKDKLDNLRLCRKWLTRLTTEFPEYEKNDEALYHLFLLYSREGKTYEANQCVELLKQDFPESDWTLLLSDPNFAENQRFGVHIEDSLYAATYDAFKADRHQEVTTNTRLSESRFPLGQHRPKFIFIEGLSMLNDGDSKGCMECMKTVVEKYPESEVTEMAGMILKGVQDGRALYGGKFDMGDIWSRRTADLLTGDSTQVDSLIFERETSYIFLLAYQPDSVNQNQLLYEMAKYNFTSYLVRNFDIVIDQDPHGLCRMLVSGFLSYDEARQYARQLRENKAMTEMLQHCRHLIVSEQNLRLLGTVFSYHDYELFYDKEIAPVEISTQPLLEEPEIITQEEEPEAETQPEEGQQTSSDPLDDLFNDGPQQQNGNMEFDDDFWR